MPKSDPKKKPPIPNADEVDEASDESFPASDPPANQPLHPGKPAAHPDHKVNAPKPHGRAS